MADQLSVDAVIAVGHGNFRLDVAIAVRPGASLALTGPNGAGKTTLLRTLAGVQPIDAGQIRMGGIVVDEPATRTWIPPERRSVGFLFQDHRLFPSMSALDNIAFGLRARGMTRRAAATTARDWLATVGLEDRGSAKASDLSGGQAQRVALARALTVEPKLVLLDEPFASVDEASRESMLAVLADLDVTLLLATHDQTVVNALADSALELIDGRPRMQAGM